VNDVPDLRGALAGLIDFAAGEEEALLELVAAAGPEEDGSPQRWAAAPLVAHNTEFKQQQLQRLDAIGNGETPPVFAEINHGSEAVYRHYSELSAGVVRDANRQVSQALVAAVHTTSDEDLLDPSRNPWLGGRKLWLQIAVRGFWHPTGHLGEYYCARGQAARAVDLQERAVAVGLELRAPDETRGMACYNLACAQARSGHLDEALDALSEAIQLNSDLYANASRDADLEILRQDERLESLLGGR
jgi:tetratricopeptide (TPR) repeat protein